ncbi:transcription factor TGA2.2 [Ricinus communis]|uniref:Transcription factor HBP-1b(C1), putative n=1 Tax=Ricinus communis TaxID=3988 RepID=B9ST26_RICCO|nr:transcription factor TGA2.2 [Ricinus communis]EEF33258.1 Transcription factor HBP-1b(c1), putative [Ricinus communis]|eukprot:XP_002529145.1 transcription factor TGA2.2 [Ricinus communis]
MQSSFKAAPPTIPHPELMYCHSNSFFLREDNSSRNQTRFADLGELDDQPPFNQHDAVDLSPSSMFSLKSGNVTVLSNNLHYAHAAAALNTSIGSAAEIATTGAGCLDTGQYMYHKGTTIGSSLGNGHHNNNNNNNNNGIENWGDSGVADNSQQTDTSTDVDTDERNQLHGLQHGTMVVVDSMDQSKAKAGDQKTLRRLAQNREAARKSRLRKKAYVQQLENSRLKLAQLEQELQRARQQGMFVATGFSGDHGAGNGAVAFDMDYTRWLEEQQRLINDLRSAVNSHMTDNELCLLVDAVMAHYDEIFRLKSIGTKVDVFHMLSGMWKTPAERCFMWLGGFRSSELLKILGNHLEPLTDQQLMGICNLQQSSQQAEDALSQGMEALQQSLVDTLSSTTLGPAGSGNVADYMGQMAIAMGKLATLENFLHQADLLRQQTLQQMHRILTTRQAARALLVINDYTSRLRALSSLWLARPRD